MRSSHLVLLMLVVAPGIAGAKCCDPWGARGRAAFIRAGASEVRAVTQSTMTLGTLLQQLILTSQQGFLSHDQNILQQSASQKVFAEGQIASDSALVLTREAATAKAEMAPVPSQDQTIASAMLLKDMKSTVSTIIKKNNSSWLSDFYQVTPKGITTIVKRHEPYCSADQAAAGACAKAASALLQNADLTVNTLLEPGGGQDETISDEEAAAALAFIKTVTQPIPEAPITDDRLVVTQYSDQAVLSLAANSFHAILAHRTRRHMYGD